jgi:hypothetical protein
MKSVWWLPIAIGALTTMLAGAAQAEGIAETLSSRGEIVWSVPPPAIVVAPDAFPHYGPLIVSSFGYEPVIYNLPPKFAIYPISKSSTWRRSAWRRPRRVVHKVICCCGRVRRR